MARYRVLAWRGIPSQVKARDTGGRPVTVPLPDWFGQEIDRVAMRDGAIGEDAYLAGWDWSKETDRDGAAGDVALAVATELAAEWGRTLAGSTTPDPDPSVE